MKKITGSAGPALRDRKQCHASCVLPAVNLQIVTNLAHGLQALTFVPDGNQELLDMFERWSIAYSKVLTCHLREDGDVQKALEVSSLNLLSQPSWWFVKWTAPYAISFQ